MIKCKTKAIFDFLTHYYIMLYGSVLLDKGRRIIYTPEDEIYKNKYLNRRKKVEKENK